MEVKDILMWLYGSGTVTSVITYATNNNAKVTITGDTPFDVAIQSHTYNAATGKGTIILNGTVTSVSDNVFMDNANLTSITLPSTIRGMGGGVFANCTALTSITLPSSLMNINGTQLFSGCTALTSIHFPNSCQTWSDQMCAGCTALTTVNVPTALTGTIGQECFMGCSSLSSPIVLPSGVTEIGAYAFTQCENVPSIVLNEGLETISTYALAYMTSLTSLNIPSTVTTINDMAFAFDVSLSTIKVSSSNTTYDSRNRCNAIIRTSDNTLITGCKTTTIPPTVTSLYQTSFYGISFAPSNFITIPSNITSIGRNIFYTLDLEGISFGGTVAQWNAISKHSRWSRDAYNLNRVICADDWITLNDLTVLYDTTNDSVVTAYTTPFNEAVASHTYKQKGGYVKCAHGTITCNDTVTQVNANAFLNNSTLHKIVLPDQLTTIRDSAFSGDKMLQAVTLPAMLTTIGNTAFANCTSLTEITYRASMSDWNAVTLGTNWRQGSNISTIHCTDGDITFGTYPFVYYSSTSTPITPTALNFGGAQISSNVFDPTSYLCTMTFDRTLTTIGDDAFRDCSTFALNNTMPSIPATVTTIGARAFKNTISSEIYLPDSVTTLGQNTFEGVPMNEIVLGSGITSIPANAFKDCTSLSKVTMPASVTSIGTGAFSNAGSSGMAIIDYAGTMSAWNAITLASGWNTGSGFYGVVCTDGIISLRNDAILYRTTDSAPVTSPLTNFTPTATSNTYDQAIDLGIYTFPSDVTKFGNAAFSSMTTLKAVSVPSTVTQIGMQSFQGDQNLTGIYIPSSVLSIGSSSFDGCNTLSEIHFPASITTISQMMMNTCASLTLAEIPSGVTSIRRGAFGSCNSLMTIICHATTPPTLADSTVFDFVPATCDIYVPAASVEDYQADSMWGTRWEYIQAIS